MLTMESTTHNTSNSESNCDENPEAHSSAECFNNKNEGNTITTEEKTAIEEKNAIISSLFEEIRLEASLFPTAVSPQMEKLKSEASSEKKLKKRKSELTLDMTAEDIDSILGEPASSSSPASYNPKHPFTASCSSGFNETQQKTSPPLTKYSQNNQGQRNSPQQYSQMSSFPTQLQANMGSSMQGQPSTAAQQMIPSNASNGLPNAMHNQSPLAMPPTQSPHHSISPSAAPIAPPHHSRLLQHQQSAPNLRQTGFEEMPLPPPHQLIRLPNGHSFDATLVDEFEMCVRVILMAAHRAQCRNVYRQLTAEVSELYSRVVKNQVPKKAVKKIVSTRTPCVHNERFELERQFKCLSDGLESRQSPQLYESIMNFLYKMRIAIPDQA